MTKQFALAGAHRIWIVGRDLEALYETQIEVQAAASDCKVTPLTADLTSPSDVTKLFDSLDGEVPEVLLNNAGVSLSQVHLIDSDPVQWWADWEVNIHGLYLVTRQWLKALTGRAGTVISTSSSVSDRVDPNMSSYGTSKHAVNRLTEMIQMEYGKQGVRALAFHPGGIASTGMGQAAPEQYRANLFDTVDLAASTALYLSTPEAGYLDGRFVYSNWNMEHVEQLKDVIVKDNLLVARINYGSILSADVVR
ncbi:NAD(P)-binding protein [Dissoconium aciculare CBS 342.82]|uniref:NAD(P)-binding protein n=1 Tax=Dissoconium aciculare CBS 342.82 TaxID=1314786 RepID=A0A6J3MCY1_9PEZI|nr:NAD(P)-binding protein [Dissoconium aciculare CBS 342.82]KAF1825881.1 NAD(P)-binding protein [Dissoconium aciculare CBS 342.82]